MKRADQYRAMLQNRVLIPALGAADKLFVLIDDFIFGRAGEAGDFIFV